MAAAYSYDLRIKVMKFLDEKNTVKDASKIFNISRKAIIYLKHLYYDTNNSIFDRKCGTKTSARVHMIWT